MGRLDAVAKKKVIELRESGLSFRKIKAVLELENIKVSAQAIYLFLKEFHGRPPGRVRPLEAGSTSSSEQMQPLVGTSRGKRSNIHVPNICQEASHCANLLGNRKFTEQTSTFSEADANLSRKEGSQLEHQHNGNKEEKGIQIVGVTSFAQNNQQINLQSTATRAEMNSVSSTLASGALTRRRVTPSPAISPILAARKRLLDKALSQRVKQTSSSIRRDQQSSHVAHSRTTSSQPFKTFDLTSERNVMGRQPVQNGSTRRFLAVRPGLSVRSLHPLPRVGVHIPNRSASPLTSSASVVSVAHLQSLGGQVGEKQSPKQRVADPEARGGLQDQIQTLSSEIHGLGLALKMLVEQQHRLEREQAQQTQIQKQILSALQSFSSRLGSCFSAQQHHHNQASSSPDVPSGAISDSFGFSEGAYTQCSQTQPSYNSMESLDTSEAFKVPVLNPSSMNGFPPCGSSENIPLSHTSPPPPYAAAYSQQSSQTLVPTYTQPYVSAYSEAHQAFRGGGGGVKTTDFASSCSVSSLQDCSMSTQPQEPHSNVIKVEGP